MGQEAEAALGEHVEPEVAASFDAFVGLLGRDRADEADDRVAVGKLAALADLYRQRVVGDDDERPVS